MNRRRTVRAKLCIIILSGQLMLALQAPGATEPAQQDSWDNLNHVTHRRTYTFVDRGSNCVGGEIVTVTDRSVTLKRLDWLGGTRPKYVTLTIERPNVLRIEDGGDVIDVVYSGRSSWSELQGFQHLGSVEAVLLITKDGKRHKGKLVEVSDKQVKLAHSNKTSEITKAEVSQVYYIRSAPISDGAQYTVQEMGWIGLVDPELWPYVLHIPPKISVLLYDSSMPEDDAPVECKTHIPR
jgi:hypothetical protein